MSGCQRLGTPWAKGEEGEEPRCGHERAQEGSPRRRHHSVLLLWWHRQVSTRTIHFYIILTGTPRTRTQMSSSETGKISIKSVDCIDVNILVSILYYSFTKRYHWRKRGNRYRDLLSLITACKSKIILIEVSTTHIHTHAITEHQLGGRKSPCWQLRITMGQ